MNGYLRSDGRKGIRNVTVVVYLVECAHHVAREVMFPFREQGVHPYESRDADTQRIWWTDSGVHQNLTFPVQPDPISGMHCWHQAVRVRKAEPSDQYGDISVDIAKSREAYKEWMAKTRPASTHSPDGTRRPYWMMRPLKPSREIYRLPT